MVDPPGERVRRELERGSSAVWNYGNLERRL